jgi:hypothetical protein
MALYLELCKGIFKVRDNNFHEASDILKRMRLSRLWCGEACPQTLGDNNIS